MRSVRLERTVKVACTWVIGMALLLPSLHAQDAAQAAEQTLVYDGTIGQQRVSFRLHVEGGVVADASYRYLSQKEGVECSESRVFGTTVVLADDDGNVFHLHLRNADGTTAIDFAHAEKLDGTMQRNELDLPVLVVREKPQPGR